jgi:hypothetical protein
MRRPELTTTRQWPSASDETGSQRNNSADGLKNCASALAKSMISQDRVEIDRPIRPVLELALTFIIKQVFVAQI